jgi:hypothetical protein
MDPVPVAYVFSYMICNHAKYILAATLVNLLVYSILIIIIIIFLIIGLADGTFLQQKNISWYN